MEQGDNNMAVAEVEDGLGQVRRKPSKMMEKSKLYTVAPMPVLLLCRGQVGLENFNKVLDVHHRLLPFLVS